MIYWWVVVVAVIWVYSVQFISKYLPANNFKCCFGGIYLDEFKYTKGLIRIRKSKKNRQKNNYKRTNNDRQNIHLKLKMSRLYYTYDCITFFEIMLQTVWNNWTLSKTEEIFGNSYINNRGINTIIICKLKNILFICKKKSIFSISLSVTF